MSMPYHVVSATACQTSKFATEQGGRDVRNWILCIGLSVCLNLCIIIYLLCSVSPIGCVHCIIPTVVWLSIGSLNVHSVIGIVHIVWWLYCCIVVANKLRFTFSFAISAAWYTCRIAMQFHHLSKHHLHYPCSQVDS